MNQSFFNVEIEQFGHALETRAFSSATGVLDCCREFEGANDVTLALYPLSSRRRLLLGFDQGFVFVALDIPTGIYQFKPSERQPEAPQSFQIGGHETELVSDYLLPAPLSAEIVQRWIADDDEPPKFGFWERK